MRLIQSRRLHGKFARFAVHKSETLGEAAFFTKHLTCPIVQVVVQRFKVCFADKADTQAFARFQST